MQEGTGLLSGCCPQPGFEIANRPEAQQRCGQPLALLDGQRRHLRFQRAAQPTALAAKLTQHDLARQFRPAFNSAFRSAFDSTFFFPTCRDFHNSGFLSTA